MEAMRPRLRNRHKYSIRGFSLIETLVVVAILAILAGTAAPAFQQMVERYQVGVARDHLVVSFQFARNEAIRSGQQVIIQRKAGCPVNNWGCGWTIFQDLNRNGLREFPAEPIVGDAEALRGVSIAPQSLFPDTVTIDNFGEARSPHSYRIGPKGNNSSPDCLLLAFNFGLNGQSTEGAANCPP